MSDYRSICLNNLKIKINYIPSFSFQSKFVPIEFWLTREDLSDKEGQSGSTPEDKYDFSLTTNSV